MQRILLSPCTSGQVFPKQLMLRELPPEMDILCTHPMFGPDSGRGSWQGLNLMYEKVRVGDDPRRQARVDKFLRVGAVHLCAKCLLAMGTCHFTMTAHVCVTAELVNLTQLHVGTYTTTVLYICMPSACLPWGLVTSQRLRKCESLPSL